MSILSWIALGIVAGAVAKLIIPGRQPGGIILTMVLGIVGALLGGFLGGLLLRVDVTGFNLSSVLISVAGSVLVLLIWGAVAGREREG